MRSVTLLVLFFCASLVSAEQRTKEVGIYEAVYATKDDEAEVILNSGELEELFERRGVRYHDRETEEWVASIGEKLAPIPKDPYITYRFFVIRDPSPNAFALPDGQIYVHTGMLARLQNEAQLACLLGHEIIHVAGHHGILAHRSNKRKGQVGAVFGGVFGVVGAAGGWTGVAGNLAAGVTNISVVSAMLGYSRDLESEADTRAFDMLIDSPYDVAQCGGLFAVMREDYDGLQPVVNAKWSTHPDLKDRQAYMENRVTNLDGYSPSERVTGEDAFVRMTYQVRLDTIDDYIDARYPATAVALAERLTLAREDDSKGWAALGRAYVELGPESADEDTESLTKKEKTKRLRDRHRMTRDELRAKQLETEDGQANLNRNLTTAVAAFNKALTLNPDDATTYFELGGAYEGLEAYEDAARAYVKHLRLDPESIERPNVMAKLRNLKDQISEQKGSANDE